MVDDSSPLAMSTDLDNLETLLRAWNAGDLAARDALFAQIYPDLKQLARRHLRGEADGHTLNTTALVHETCLGVLGDKSGDWRGRAQFFAFVSMVMRHVLIDHARQRRAQKRDGQRVRVALHDDIVGQSDDPDALLDLEAALTKLEEHSTRMARVVECRLFGGMTDLETARALDMGERSVSREWQRGKAWLRVALAPSAEGQATLES